MSADIAEAVARGRAMVDAARRDGVAPTPAVTVAVAPALAVEHYSAKPAPWEKCSRCGCLRPPKELAAGSCLDTGWCSRHAGVGKGSMELEPQAEPSKQVAKQEDAQRHEVAR